MTNSVHPDRGESIERRAITNLERSGRSPDEAIALLRDAQAGSSPAVYRRALEFQADSALLGWDECLRVAELFESVGPAPEVPAAS